MTLRNQTLTRIGLTIVGLIVVLYAASRTILMRGFDTLEQDYIRQDVGRVRSALLGKLDDLEIIVADWAPWDDTYEFVQDGNAEYIDSNLMGDTFTNFGINTMLFVDDSGQLVYGQNFDLYNEEKVPVPSSMYEYIVGDDLLTRHTVTESVATGIVLLPEGPMLVSSQPILTNDSEGPIRGAMMMGLYLDDDVVDKLAKTTYLSLTLQLDGQEMPPDFQTARSALTDDESIFIQILEPETAQDIETIAGYTLLQDIHGEPAFVMRVDTPRDIYEQGRTSVSYFAISLLAVGLVFTLVTLLLLESQVLSRLARISKDVGNISVSGDRAGRVPVTGQDELSSLASEINGMLTALQQSDVQLEERNRELARRTRYLEATAEVAQNAAAVLDPQELLSRVVALISERFGFYHTAIFLLDPDGEWAVLQAASSRGGQRLLARGFRLLVGQQGIVGYVTGRGEPRVALNVGADAAYFDTPELPDTRSEMAWPLRARGEIIGALDVQSKKAKAFTEEDVAVLHTLADQIAMALSNARLVQQLQNSLERQQRVFGELSRRAWTDALHEQPNLGYRYFQGDVVPLTGPPKSEASMPEANAQGANAQGADAQGADGETEYVEPAPELPEIALPLKVRENVIGTINVHKSGETGDWTPDEVSLLETLTDQLGVALEGARLYQEAQHRATRERLVGEVTARMRETLDVDTMLKTSVIEIRRALDIAEVEVRLDTTQTLTGQRDGGSD